MPFRFITELILANFICLMLLVAIRCWGYLSGLRSGIRYGADRGRPASANDLARPIVTVRADLEGAGYRFSGRKRIKVKTWSWARTKPCFQARKV